jgi:hypothetical protein
MLSFKKGDRKIAVIKGGKHHNKILKYNDKDSEQKTIRFEESDEESSEEERDFDFPLEYLDDDFFDKKIKGRKTLDKKNKKIDSLQKAICKKRCNHLDDDLKPLYREARKEIKEKIKKEYIIEDTGHLYPLPQTSENGSERGMVCGPSGSGKSTYVSEYIKNYRKLHPKSKVWVFSRLSSDPALDKHKINRIMLDKGIVENPIEPKELSDGKHTLCIFDDIDTIPDKDIKNAVRKLRDDINETGRHDKISNISTSHQICNYKLTRDLLLESAFVTFFPKSGMQAQARSFLKTYCGLDKPTIEKILALPSRWVTIYKTYPIMVLHQKGCFLP